ncbi:hypothetical protein ACFO5Q_09810 [Kordiimonas lipolytica]|uniref:Uncharacterized protein n=1 Tax=Kordiimonas lipolytica TaxID=1662421 RepID=A0ABV8UBV8_9PROT|nr:hypothetical protein [Kordiimonas lipolytica]
MKANRRKILVALAVVSTVILLASSPVLISIWFSAFASNKVIVINESSFALEKVTVSIAQKQHQLGNIAPGQAVKLKENAGPEGVVGVEFHTNTQTKSCETGYTAHSVSTRTTFVLRKDGTLENSFSYAPHPLQEEYFACKSKESAN